MSDELREELNPVSEGRREAMLSELTAAMRRTHRTRRLRRHGVSAAAVAFAALAIVRLGTVPIPNADGPPVLVERPNPGSPIQPSFGGDGRRPKCMIELVQTDRAILDRLAARPIGRPTVLDDRSLITALAQIDRPAGLIRSAKKVRLSGPVTDAELQLQR